MQNHFNGLSILTSKKPYEVTQEIFRYEATKEICFVVVPEHMKLSYIIPSSSVLFTLIDSGTSESREQKCLPYHLQPKTVGMELRLFV